MDNNATTPIHPRVADAVRPFLDGLFGNPSSLHFAGRDIKETYEAAREQIAAVIGAKANDVVITSCGSEADNQALLSAAAIGRGAGGLTLSPREGILPDVWRATVRRAQTAPTADVRKRLTRLPAVGARVRPLCQGAVHGLFPGSADHGAKGEA